MEKIKNLKIYAKLLPSIAMFLVSALLIATASYAWFAMSYVAEISGIALSLSTPANIMVSNEFDDIQDYFEDGVLKPDTDKTIWGFTINFNPEESATQSTLHKPTSSIDGTNFFIAVRNVYDGFPRINTKMSALTGDVTPYYAEYKVFLKNTGTSSTPVTIGDFSVTKTGGTKDGINAIRLALSEYTTHTVTPASETPFSTVKTVFNAFGDGEFVPTNNILRLSGASYGYTGDPQFDGENGLEIVSTVGPIVRETGGDDPLEDLQGVNDDGSLADSTKLIEVQPVDSEGVYTVYELTIRLWFEGQDASCNMSDLYDENIYYASFKIKITHNSED